MIAGVILGLFGFFHEIRELITRNRRFRVDSFPISWKKAKQTQNYKASIAIVQSNQANQPWDNDYFS